MLYNKGDKIEQYEIITSYNDKILFVIDHAFNQRQLIFVGDTYKYLESPHVFPRIVNRFIGKNHEICLVQQELKGVTLKSILQSGKLFDIDTVIEWSIALCKDLQLLLNGNDNIGYVNLTPMNTILTDDKNLIYAEIYNYTKYQEINMNQIMKSIGSWMYQLLVGDINTPARQVDPCFSYTLENTLKQCINEKAPFETFDDLSRALQSYQTTDDMVYKYKKELRPKGVPLQRIKVTDFVAESSIYHSNDLPKFKKNTDKKIEKNTQEKSIQPKSKEKTTSQVFSDNIPKKKVQSNNNKKQHEKINVNKKESNQKQQSTDTIKKLENKEYAVKNIDLTNKKISDTWNPEAKSLKQTIDVRNQEKNVQKEQSSVLKNPKVAQNSIKKEQNPSSSNNYEEKDKKQEQSQEKNHKRNSNDNNARNSKPNNATNQNNKNKKNNQNSNRQSNNDNKNKYSQINNNNTFTQGDNLFSKEFLEKGIQNEKKEEKEREILSKKEIPVIEVLKKAEDNNETNEIVEVLPADYKEGLDNDDKVIEILNNEEEPVYNIEEEVVTVDVTEQRPVEDKIIDISEPINVIDSNITEKKEEIIEEKPIITFTEPKEELKKESRFKKKEKTPKEPKIVTDHAYYNPPETRESLLERLKGFPIAIKILVPLFTILISSVTGYVLYKNHQEEKYRSYIQLAVRSTEKKQQLSECKKAIELLPGRIEAYDKMLEIYTEDAILTTKEENAFQTEIHNNWDELKRNDDYGVLAYHIGRAYWYYYNYGTDTDNEITRMKAATQWFEDSLEYEDTKQYHSIAKIYIAIGKFNKNVVLSVETGEDGGTYKKYFKNLSKLVSYEKSNDVAKLELYKLVVNSIDTYRNNFMADGVEQVKIDEVRQQAIDKTNQIQPATQKATTLKNEILKK